MDAKIRSAVEEVTKIMPYLKGDGNEPHCNSMILKDRYKKEIK